MKSYPGKPDKVKTPNNPAILRRRAGAVIGGLALLSSAGLLAQGIANGASTTKLMDQLSQKGKTVMDEYTGGQIDAGAVKVIEIPTNGKPILAWDEAAKLESDQKNIQPLTDMIQDQAGGATVEPGTVLVLPKDLIKPSVQPVK